MAAKVAGGLAKVISLKASAAAGGAK
jgi:hypothetical protein